MMGCLIFTNYKHRPIEENVINVCEHLSCATTMEFFSVILQGMKIAVKGGENVKRNETNVLWIAEGRSFNGRTSLIHENC